MRIRIRHGQLCERAAALMQCARLAVAAILFVGASFVLAACVPRGAVAVPTASPAPVVTPAQVREAAPPPAPSPEPSATASMLPGPAATSTQAAAASPMPSAQRPAHTYSPAQEMAYTLQATQQVQCRGLD